MTKQSVVWVYILVYIASYSSVAVARYVQTDPIGLYGGSWSTYTYVNGNPVSSVDPFGLEEWPGGWPAEVVPSADVTILNDFTHALRRLLVGMSQVIPRSEILRNKLQCLCGKKIIFDAQQDLTRVTPYVLKAQDGASGNIEVHFDPDWGTIQVPTLNGRELVSSNLQIMIHEVGGHASDYCNGVSSWPGGEEVEVILNAENPIMQQLSPNYPERDPFKHTKILTLSQNRLSFIREAINKLSNWLEL